MGGGGTARVQGAHSGVRRAREHGRDGGGRRSARDGEARAREGRDGGRGDGEAGRAAGDVGRGRQAGERGGGA
eukprot:4400478-Pleurochrysis_carterae.AAC.1